LRVDPHVLPAAEAGLVDEARGDLQELRRAGDDDLVPVEVGALLPDDVRIEKGRLLDLVELVLVRLQAVLPLLDLVPEAVEVPLVLPPEAVDLLLEFLAHIVRRLLIVVRFRVYHSEFTRGFSRLGQGVKNTPSHLCANGALLSAPIP